MAAKRTRLITPVWVQEIFDELVGRLSPNTARAYRQDVDAFRKWAKEATAADALHRILTLGRVEGRQLVEKFERYLAPRFAHSTTNRRLAALKSFVAEARRAGAIDWRLEVRHTKNLSRETKMATGKRNMAGLDPERFDRLVDALRADQRPVGKRDLAIIGLLENPMLRRSEVAALNVGDLDLANPNQPRVRLVGKGRRETENLPLPPR